MLSKSDISHQLTEGYNSFADMVAQLDEQRFTAAPPDKWNAGQQLDHILRSVKPLTMALGLPKMAVRVLIGKANRPSKNYDELVAKYHRALSEGAKATGKYVPPATVAYSERKQLAESVKDNVAKLVTNLTDYTEEDLDLYILPHPLLGKLTVREMLYFTIYHVGHHHRVTLQNMESRVMASMS